MGLMELFNSYDKKKRRNHFRNLFFLARADGEVDRSEMDIIIDLAEGFHMSTQEVTKIIRNPDTVAEVIPKTREERMEQLYDLITVMLVDGQIDEKELFFCKRMAVRLGWAEEAVNPLVRDMIETSINGTAHDKAVAKLMEKYPWPA